MNRLMLSSRAPNASKRALGLNSLNRDSLDHYRLALLNTNEAIYLD